MSERVTCIRPGILVGLHVSVQGGRAYQTQQLGESKEGETESKTWQTTRIVSDMDEWQRAEKVRSECRRLIQAVCIPTEFGLVCPKDKEEDLWEAIATARRQATEFNEHAVYSHVRVRALPARVAENEAEAARAITGEIAELMNRMEQGVISGDVAAVRDAANRARRLGSMLDDQTVQGVSDAIEAARLAARALVRRVEKQGEVLDTVLNDLMVERSAIAQARFQFLELEQSASVKSDMPQVDLNRFAELDTENKPSNGEAKKTPEQPELDL